MIVRRRTWKRIILAVVILVIVGMGVRGWWGMMHQVKASRIYSVEAIYRKIPVTDDRLESWLKRQPGVADHTVHVTREGKGLQVEFIMSQDLWKEPSFPDLEKGCREAGYGDMEEGWHDRMPRK